MIVAAPVDEVAARRRAEENDVDYFLDPWVLPGHVFFLDLDLTSPPWARREDPGSLPGETRRGGGT